MFAGPDGPAFFIYKMPSAQLREPATRSWFAGKSTCIASPLWKIQALIKTHHETNNFNFITGDSIVVLQQ
jgi:hypothetical protein